MDLARSIYYDAPTSQPIAAARLLARITEIRAGWRCVGFRCRLYRSLVVDARPSS